MDVALKAAEKVRRRVPIGGLADQLWATTMDPQRRTLLRVNIEDAARADELFVLLMGNQTDPRREWIVEHAHFAEQLDI